MKFGKPLLYILVFIVLTSFIDNTDIATIYRMQESLDSIGNSISDGIYELNASDFLASIYDTVLWDRGAEFLALIIILIFYLGVDKKVWK